MNWCKKGRSFVLLNTLLSDVVPLISKDRIHFKLYCDVFYGTLQNCHIVMSNTCETGLLLSQQ